KSICNKFPQPSPVTCMAWPSTRVGEVVFGLAEGKVKIGQLKSNKPASLYSSGSYCAAIAASPDGNGIASSHADGTIYRFLFDDNGARPSHTKLVVHSCVPYALSWGQSIVVFYDMDGGMERTFDYTTNTSCREFTTATFNPTGDSVALGNYDSFRIYTHDRASGSWEEACERRVENMYTVTALAWRADGSRLAVGALCGVVDVYDACVRRTRYKGRFEFTFVSLSQVIVKRLSSGARIVLKSGFGCEISRVNIYQDRQGSWRYLTLEEGILGAVRTDHISAHLLSVRLSEKPPRPSNPGDMDSGIPKDAAEGEKMVAYLLDAQTINVKVRDYL
ncbi:unnamed protein product, partial [Choristocarpus tenellus]